MDSKIKESSYWTEKLTSYFNKPFYSAFANHSENEWSDLLKTIFSKVDIDEALLKKAHFLSSGYDINMNSSMDSKDIVLTHPVSQDGELKINSDEINNLKKPEASKKFQNDIITAVKNGLAMVDLSADSEYRKFLYSSFFIRDILSHENVGNLGGLWHRIPDNLSFPDRSVWNKSALTSAFYSISKNFGNDEMAIMLYSITPVQKYISTARKLRDYWSGSVILSWLAFEGISHIMENFGPDHIVYPSLFDQPLMLNYLRANGFDALVKKYKKSIRDDVANFPNKFMAIIPLSAAKETGEQIKQRITRKWEEIRADSAGYLSKKMSLDAKSTELISEMFSDQSKNFWTMNFSALKIFGSSDKSRLDLLYSEDSYKKENTIAELFKKISTDSFSSEGFFYSLSCQTVQSLLACDKASNKILEISREGEKCHQCGEYEALHYPVKKDPTSAEYKKSSDSFWSDAADKLNKFDLNGNEKLCSHCLVKRIAYATVKSAEGHILQNTFKKAATFPSTAQIALTEYFERNNITNTDSQYEAAQELFDEGMTQGKKVLKNMSNSDNYYALLLMDGDKMGDLIGGETLTSSWSSVVNSVFKQELLSSAGKDMKEIFGKLFSDEKLKKYIISPALHTDISESLGDFALYGVSEIIERYSGKLIYAGGDDVCAILPYQTALSASEEIKDFYTSNFRSLSDENEIISDKKWKPVPGKLSLGLGSAVSISAAILICHYKESLKEMIERAHGLLSVRAKEQCGRNACVIELRKRAGGSRFFGAKWDDHIVWKALKTTGININNMQNTERISKSLVYRLNEFKDGINALIDKKDDEMLKLFIESLLKKSLFRYSKAEDTKASGSDIAEIITRNMIKDQNSNSTFSSDGLIISAYISGSKTL